MKESVSSVGPFLNFHAEIYQHTRTLFYETCPFLCRFDVAVPTKLQKRAPLLMTVKLFGTGDKQRPRTSARTYHTNIL
jgi:hypothetical protein